ncbi:SAM-dependent methyltransferase [Trebonia kvetii]|uniref:SAM-dependent methyltransferase n=1 Tax=Trebonia kvetii TaxID=2480626 RepID=A0A6P2BMM9_9ACTN|nr:SAM-dependent methyltransferase [Trebonia kvetii]TVZ00329.1 SAM-dependent methyltransferase [Trebonia kvetii]
MSEEWLAEASRPVRAAKVDSSAPNVARVWNAMLGGRDNFEVDRRAARQLIATAPVLAHAAYASRAFLRRAVRYQAEAGIRQFLDIGTGLPTKDATHEVAQATDPSCRVVYVDNDPVVLVHARARMRSDAEGTTGYLNADATDIPAVLGGAAQTLDLAQPVGILMIDVLTFIADAADVVAGLVAAAAAGSYLTVMHPAEDQRLTVAQRLWNRDTEPQVHLRSRCQIGSWLDGLELVDPGLVEVNQWRPAPDDPECPDDLPLLAAVAKKP